MLLRRALLAPLLALVVAGGLLPHRAAAQTPPDPLSAWHDALANAAGEPADALFLGNSITQGASAQRRADWWVDIARRWMQGAWGGAGAGFLPVTSSYFAEGRWVTAGGVEHPSAGLGLRAYLLDGAGDFAEVTVTGTSVRLSYATGPDLGTMRVLVDGAEVATLATTEPTRSSAQWSSGPLGPGPHALRVEPVMSGPPRNRRPVVVEGVAVFDGDEDAGVHVWDASHGGYGTTHFVAQQGWAASAADVDPELVVVELGTNDYAFQLSAAEFEANLREIVRAATDAATGPVSVVLLPMWLGSGRDPARYGAYVDVQRRLADELGLALVDLSALDAGLFTDDGVHPIDVGQRAIADRLLDAVDPSYRPATTPVAPASVTAAAGPAPDSATVTWPASEGAAGYVVRALDPANPAVVVEQVRVTGTTATVSGLTPGATYAFSVHAEGQAGFSGPATSEPVTLDGPPAAPTGVTATAITGGATVTWQAAAAATDYLVQIFDLTADTFVRQETTTATEITLTGLAPGHDHAFLVYAHNAAGYSPGSGSNTVTVPPDQTPPPAPTGVTATAITGGATVTWQAAAGATDYLVQILDVSTGQLVAERQTAATELTVTGLARRHEYEFVVYARNAAGLSPGTTSNRVVVRR